MSLFLSSPTPNNDAALIPFKEPRSLAGLAVKPPAVFLPNQKTADCFFGFFTANHQNKNTRRAYYKAVCRFSDWCEGRGLESLETHPESPPATALSSFGGPNGRIEA